MRTRFLLGRYVLSEVRGPLALGFLVYTFILLIRFLFQSAEMIIRRGLAVSVVLKLLLVSLPNIVVLTLPMSLLFGILIAAGRLSSDSELIAMRSCGVSLLALYRPILLLSGAATLLNLALMVYALPWGNHSLQQLRLDIMTQTMSQQVEPRVFYEEWVGKTIYVFETRNRGKRWKGVFLAEGSPMANQNSDVTVADWGDLQVDDAGQRVVLRLTNAIQHSVNLANPGSYEALQHKSLDIVLEDQFSSDQRAKMSAAKGIRELTLAELRRVSRDRTTTQEQRNLAQVEINKKFSIPAACLVFGLFALPLGINNRRGGKASGFALSIGVIVLYYLLLNNGEEAARFGRVPGWFAMWLPNILLAAAGSFLLMRRNRDKSLLLSGVDRWIRTVFWARLLSWGLPRLQRAKPSELPQSVPQRRSSPKLVLRLPRPRLISPSLMDRYIGGLFGRVFLLVLCSGLMLFIIFDLTELIDDILKNKIHTSTVLTYYKYLSIQIFYTISPIVVLVTTLMTFILLTRTNEVIACKALGMSLYRLALPALAAALGVSLLCGYLESGVLPAANERVAQLKDRIHGRETPRTYRRADRQWLFGQGRYIYNYAHYDREHQSLQRLQVFDFDESHHLARRLYAENAKYVGDEAWLFENGWARSFQGTELTGYVELKPKRIVRYPETPAYFDSEIRPPDEMGFRELKNYVSELKDSGQSVPELEVSLYNKISFPVISFVMAMVALPFAFRIGRQGTLYGIGLSVVLGMIFLSIYAFFTKLGEAGALPPLLSVWAPGAVFALLSMYLFLGVKT